MNTQPNPSQFEKLSARPAPSSGLGRYMPYVRGMVAGGALVGVAAGLATALLPDGYRPGDLAGKFAGGASKWDNKEATDAAVERERRIAEAVAKAQAEAQAAMQIAVARATAEAQAKMQIDVEANRQALEAATQSNSLNSLVAGLADAACAGSQVIQAIGVQNTGRSLQDGAQTTAGVACGFGNVIRGEITRSQNRAVVAATTARGLPQSVPTLPAPQQAAAPQPQGAPMPELIMTVTQPSDRLTERALRQVYAISQPRRYYTMVETAQASRDLARFSPTINANVRAGMEGWTIDRSRGVFTERVQALVALAGE